MNGMAFLAVKSLGIMLGPRRALADVSFAAERGTLIALAGPNGAGKSTLLRALAGLADYSGEILIEGVEGRIFPARARARRIAYLPQERAAHWPMTVERVASIGRLPHGAMGPDLSPEDAAAVERALGATDASSLRTRRIDKLSGGERARALLARALASEADMLLADEPTEALDPAHRLRIMQALKEEAARGALVIAAMHDLPLAFQFADRALLLSDGKLAGYGATEEVLTIESIESVYGVRPAEAAGPLGPRWELAR